MTTYDIVEVRNFTAELNAKMVRCDNGEGMECASLDESLRHYASLCCEFRENYRAWAARVFSGSVALDPQVEHLFQSEGKKLFNAAYRVLREGAEAEVPCYMLDGQHALRSSIWDLQNLLTHPATMKPAVSPAARIVAKVKGTALEQDMRERLKAIPAMPADWEPGTLQQKQVFRRLRRTATRKRSAE